MLVRTCSGAASIPESGRGAFLFQADDPESLAAAFREVGHRLLGSRRTMWTQRGRCWGQRHMLSARPCGHVRGPMGVEEAPNESASHGPFDQEGFGMAKQRRLLMDAMTLQDFADDPEAGGFTEEDVHVGRKHV